MRLVVQAQSVAAQQAVRSAFEQLAPEDLAVLGFEMSLTGVRSQAYQASPARGGPAFLVYYSPAFVRQFSNDMRTSLRILAEVYRAARKAYPLDCNSELDVLDEAMRREANITVRIDQLKGCSAIEDVPIAYDDGYCWVLVVKSAREANVEKHRLADLSSLPTSSPVVVLEFWRNNLRPTPGDPPASTSGNSDRALLPASKSSSRLGGAKSSGSSNRAILPANSNSPRLNVAK